MNTRNIIGIGSGLLLVALVAACAVPTPTLRPVLPPTATPIPPTTAPTQVPPSLTPTTAPGFNFPQGAEWTYQGIVKWDDKGKAQQKMLTWKMQIVDRIEHGAGIVGYVMKGHPHDLAFYTEDKKPSAYLYLTQANRVYQITLIDAKPIARVKDKNDALADLLTDANLVYDFPLTANKQFGPAQFANQGEMNVWVVAEVKLTPLTSVKGIAPVNVAEAVLNFKTNPDRQTVSYVANVGITQFVYHHNGTLSDVDVKLIEYNPGAPIASPAGQCALVVSKPITAYTRPSLQAAVFGKLSVGDQLPVSAATADGWLGFDPGVAQAANVGPFRWRWVQKSDALKLEGACAQLPVVASLPPTACFQMFLEQTKIYTSANAASPVLATAQPEDYAQVIAANDKWLELDLNVGSFKQAKPGWIARADANFNGPCDKLPAAK